MNMVSEKPRGRTTHKAARATATRPVVTRTAFLPAQDVVAPAPPMGYRGRKPVRVIKALGWKSPEAIAVLIASFFVSLACFYVAAYARVTAEGFEKVELLKNIKAVKAERESLEASIAQLTRAEHITRKAQSLQLISAPKTAIVQVGSGAAAGQTTLAPTTSSLPAIQAAPPETSASGVSPPTEPLKPIVESIP
jgi:cell division protein FtsB